MTEFVDGWIFGHTLGEGAYGEVKLVINKSSGEAVAMKMIDLAKHPDARQTVKKETTIHRTLSNPNIIQYFGKRSEPSMEYIFLEYASGGELFDRIEPDVGMPVWEAQKYFKQLISAVEYLHSKGIAHRDLKPENLLLDENDNLKVSDFGLATIYRFRGKERCLEKRCGTLPYVAPEVLLHPYHAEPADIWSCGIILVALLAGELPWDQSLAECPEYMAWRDGKYMSLTPWKKLDNSSLSLIKNILIHSPSARCTIKDIKQHRWFIKKFQRAGTIEGYIRPDETDSRQVLEDENLTRFGLSQPELPTTENANAVQINLDERQGFSFSQPAHIEDLLLCTQVQTKFTQASQQNTFQRLVRRMTRFFVKTELEATVKRLLNCLKNESYTCRVNNFGTITISTMDRRKMPLVFKANIVEMDGKILVDFRLSKGCGIEFKRRFVKIKSLLEDIILKGPVTWPIAVATECIP
ncbi:serine/threonine-protein kinase grp isoform X1 [Osmia lignaria lignaria]|uniref:serine/threonine-protein kinase grp isoform X1 n=1 Tax=Osmia lignaria lignaria TaxID=1437193 RepID=UPI001478A2BF|nr:serine/threonine-protein kinase grp isoform X1 [Osmia lignaria]XP_034193552.1 serine/threonine-protein kinase grp isoform X1 [Osmia lignaria]XP_034193553.1 serine/threonine-protein kinase grp isoform X1 [Osmia lignaria]XP_034193554.1 serine/threonine-protein kinase grp isoform X1 [Osmia lignaria]